MGVRCRRRGNKSPFPFIQRVSSDRIALLCLSDDWFRGGTEKIFFGCGIRADRKAPARMREGDGASDGVGSPADAPADLRRVAGGVDACGVPSEGSFALKRDLNRPKTRPLVRPALPSAIVGPPQLLTRILIRLYGSYCCGYAARETSCDIYRNISCKNQKFLAKTKVWP